ncbi:MAG: DUF4286 family protein [Spirosomataceae bacterium]
MILYSVTININRTVETDWLQWMKQVHIPEAIAAGLPLENKLLRLLTEIENEGTTFSCQYYFQTMEDYFTYEKIHSPALQQKHHERYQNQYVSFRTLLEVL